MAPWMNLPASEEQAEEEKEMKEMRKRAGLEENIYRPGGPRNDRCRPAAVDIAVRFAVRFATVIAGFCIIMYFAKHFLGFLSCHVVPALVGQAGPSAEMPGSAAATTPAKVRVPLEAHIMSKCPDARDCMRDMILPAMERVSDDVNFTLSYVGTIEQDNGVRCTHGPDECMGNILELCAARLYPDPKIYLGFVMCLFQDYADIPQQGLVEDCALEHAIDFKALDECASKDDTAFGVGLLRRSVQHTADV